MLEFGTTAVGMNRWFIAYLLMIIAYLLQLIATRSMIKRRNKLLCSTMDELKKSIKISEDLVELNEKFANQLDEDEKIIKMLIHTIKDMDEKCCKNNKTCCKINKTCSKSKKKK